MEKSLFSIFKGSLDGVYPFRRWTRDDRGIFGENKNFRPRNFYCFPNFVRISFIFIFTRPVSSGESPLNCFAQRSKGISIIIILLTKVKKNLF
ncbi:hypothetical protein C4544_04125 [candidate division WS5 bacterium]|uniref:Uncharacterized protein n=1 Tax=candidate division WS5 bacterium TaxID=2093353 RepID=A0A419DCR2_9BACT|nr:MAG: hypothetical protein C4544_04125 [candidate division WS5 bacterium]